MGGFYSLKAKIIEGGFHSSYGEISWWSDNGWSDNGNLGEVIMVTKGKGQEAI